MLHYIFQILFFQLFFLLGYEIFLKKETFFNYNRIYLLVTPILAFVIPWLRLEFLVEAVPPTARLIIPQALTTTPGIYSEQLPTVVVYGEKGIQLNWWLITYLLGFLVSSFLFLKKYRNLRKLFNYKQVSREKDFRIIEIPNSNFACTFFNTVFIGDQLAEDEKQHILSHELVHVKQKHSYDLIFFEFLKIIFWFNPLLYIYQSRIAGLHEFMADEEVVKTTERKSYYQQLLNTAFNTQNISFINQFFNHSLIKKRIFMLQKNKSSKLSKFKLLLIVPLMLVMLTYVACTEETNSISNEKDPTISEKIAELEALMETKETLTKEEQEQFKRLVNRKKELSVKDQTRSPSLNNKDVLPYALIDKVPAFPGCEELSGIERKKCTSRKISEFVGENFNSDLGKEAGLTGTNRVVVQFKIDQTGNIVEIKARAAHESLEKEAKRVISGFPQMQPGEQNGKAVSVMYSLPIVFKVSE